MCSECQKKDKLIELLREQVDELQSSVMFYERTLYGVRREDN